MAAGGTDPNVYADTLSQVSAAAGAMSASLTVSLSICNASATSCSACGASGASSCATLLPTSTGDAVAGYRHISLQLDLQAVQSWTYLHAVGERERADRVNLAAEAVTEGEGTMTKPGWSLVAPADRRREGVGAPPGGGGDPGHFRLHGAGGGLWLRSPGAEYAAVQDRRRGARRGARFDRRHLQLKSKTLQRERGGRRGQHDFRDHGRRADDHDEMLDHADERRSSRARARAAAT